MMKGTVGAGAVFLVASGKDLSELIAVGALGVAVSLRRFRDLDLLREEQEGWEEDGNLVGVNGDDYRNGLRGVPSSSVLVKGPGCANRDRFRVADCVFNESEKLFLCRQGGRGSELSELPTV